MKTCELAAICMNTKSICCRYCSEKETCEYTCGDSCTSDEACEFEFETTVKEEKEHE